MIASSPAENEMIRKRVVCEDLGYLMDCPSGALDKCWIPISINRNGCKPRERDSGCEWVLHRGIDKEKVEREVTYTWNTHIVLIAHMDIFNGYL